MPTPGVSTDLVANWLLNGDATDEGGLYDFTATGIDWVSDVPSAMSAVASQSGEWVQGSDVLTRSYAAALNPTEFTLCLWHKSATGSSGAYRTLLDCRDLDLGSEKGWRLYASNTNRYQIWLYNGNGPTIVQSTTAVAEDTWQHFAATYDGTNCKVYVDGVLESTVAASHVVNTSIPTQISTHYDLFNLKGRVSNPRIYSSVRSDAEIEAIYNGDWGAAPAAPTRRTLQLETRLNTRLRTHL